jgi:hypothetical protein
VFIVYYNRYLQVGPPRDPFVHHYLQLHFIPVLSILVPSSPSCARISGYTHFQWYTTPLLSRNWVPGEEGEEAEVEVE